MTPFTQLKDYLANWPHGRIPERFANNRPHERLRTVLGKLNPHELSSVGPSDLATLIRHVLRYESERANVSRKLKVPTGESPWPDAALWRQHGFSCRAFGDMCLEIEALPWEPEWMRLRHSVDGKSRISHPFAAADCEQERHPKFSLTNSPIPCDPVLSTHIAGIESYLSQAQAESVRSVVFSPEGSVLLVILPTGTGKSMVGLAAGMIGRHFKGLTLIVVPTVALAVDQVSLAGKMFPKATVDEWSSGSTKPQKQAIRQRIEAGRQDLLFTSPESLVGGLKHSILKAAESGFLRCFVIDEAHLVAQWGATFRPAFQTLSPLWRELRRLCPKNRVFKTVLMSATITEETFEDLKYFYDSDDGMKVLASVSLRAEPDTFFGECDDSSTKDERILETLRHGPRPAILYTTKRDDAVAWYERCRMDGWLRTGLMHGGSSAADRADVIGKWQDNELDLIVATSAFGLGMDKGDVRLVLHACVPETIDRFYQEIGRGGRDGRACVSLMIWEPEDAGRAYRMSAQASIGDEFGFERWNAMWNNREEQLDDLSFLNLQQKRTAEHRDSDANVAWNVRTILLLARAGIIELKHHDPPNLAHRPGESEFDHETRIEKEISENRVRIGVRLKQNNIRSQQAWEEKLKTYRADSIRASQKRKRALDDLLGSRSLSELLKETYRVEGAGIDFVETDAADVPPRPLLFSHLEIDKELDRKKQNHGPLLFVTYRITGIEPDKRASMWIEALRTLVKGGIREVCMPQDWRNVDFWHQRRNQLPSELNRCSREGFVIWRDLEKSEEEANWARHPQVPRVTFLPEGFSGKVVPDWIYSVIRPLHLVLLPEDCRDPDSPTRRIRDTNQNTVQLETLTGLLSL